LVNLVFVSFKFAISMKKDTLITSPNNMTCNILYILTNGIIDILYKMNILYKIYIVKMLFRD